MWVQTQWATSMAGAVGLPATQLRAELEARGLTAQESKDQWELIRACESAVLRVWQEERQQREQEMAAKSRR